jgi:hypothetical protein
MGLLYEAALKLRHQLPGYVTGIALCWFVPILVNYLIPRQES